MALLLAAWLAGSASAQCSDVNCSITGGPGQGYSIQIGAGLPVPAPVVNPAPPPLFIGTQMAQPAGDLVGGVGSTFGSIVIPGGLFRFEPRFQTVPVFLDNSRVFQVATDFSVAFPVTPTTFREGGRTAGTFPEGTATFREGGRTGPQNLQWCPHLPLPTVSYNPYCTGPGSPGAIANGILRYTGTAQQFGGAAPGLLAGGDADVALVLGFAPGCDPAGVCRVGHVRGSGVQPGEIGGAFGTPNGAGLSEPPALPTGHIVPPGGLGQFGTILSLAPTSFRFEDLGIPTPTNMATSFGGPWTTGQLQVQVSIAVGAPETFTLTGSNNRSSMGDGTISLVSGAVSRRTLSGPNANRGFLTFTIPEPSMGVGAGAALLVLTVCRLALRRR